MPATPFREVNMSPSIIKKRSRRSKKSTSFQPNEDFIRQATEDFIKQGGKITRIVDVREQYEDFLAYREASNPADEFLLGN